jgi:hypothetical protein
MARKFLYFVAFVIVLVIAAGIAISIWWDELSEYSLVPDTEFVELAPLAANAYDDQAMWFARPGMLDANPAAWQPEWAEGSAPAPAPEGEAKPAYAVFFIHPTSYIPIKYVNDMAWNARLDNADANKQALLFIKGMATPFNQASELWIPRYRQAVFGAFLTGDTKGDRPIRSAGRSHSNTICPRSACPPAKAPARPVA